MQRAPAYADVVARSARLPRASAPRRCEAAGVARERIVARSRVRLRQDARAQLALLRGLRRVAALGLPVLAGVSRKSMLGHDHRARRPSERMAGSVAAALLAVQRGASIVRVHDVAATRDALAVCMRSGAPIRSNEERSPMSTKIFRHRRRARARRRGPDHARVRDAARLRGGQGARARRRSRQRAPRGADRQGHAHLRLHARGRARSRASSAAGVDMLLAGRCRPRRSRTSRGRCGSRRASSSAPRTIRSRTTASSSSPPTAASCPTRSESEIEAALDAPIAVPAVGGARQGAPHATTRAGRYIEFCKGTFPERARPARHADRGRLRARRRPTTSRRTSSTSSAPT